MTFAGDPQILEITDALEQALEELPQTAAVFVVWPREGVPYIGRARQNLNPPAAHLALLCESGDLFLRSRVVRVVHANLSRRLP